MDNSASKLIFLPFRVEHLKALNANIAMSSCQNSMLLKSVATPAAGSFAPKIITSDFAPELHWGHGLQTIILAFPL